jgi:hypothetical protein
MDNNIETRGGNSVTPNKDNTKSIPAATEYPKIMQTIYDILQNISSFKILLVGLLFILYLICTNGIEFEFKSHLGDKAAPSKHIVVTIKPVSKR